MLTLVPLKQNTKKNKKIQKIFVLPFGEIMLRPELSSPPRFRIQGGGGILSNVCEQVPNMPYKLGFFNLSAQLELNETNQHKFSKVIQ